MPTHFKPRVRAAVRAVARCTVVICCLAVLAPALASAASFSAVLHAPNHSPVENQKWWITVDVTHGSTKLSGDVNYEFLFSGTVVSHQPGHKFTKGLYKDDLIFPAEAVGKPLTLRIVVKTKYGTKYLNWNVTTKV
jgi:hypothetical protein